MKLPKFVKKRNESIVRFKKANIVNSLRKTFKQVSSKAEPQLIKNLTERVCQNIARRKKELISVDEIRNAISKTLKDQGLKNVADMYDFVFLHIPNPVIKRVTKRDGSSKTFQPYKIFKGINKSFEQAGQHNPKKAEELTREVMKILEKRFEKEGKITSEIVKETTEYVLVKKKFPKVANAYILNRYM
jgi:2-phosphoglycerate kinase